MALSQLSIKIYYSVQDLWTIIAIQSITEYAAAEPQIWKGFDDYW